MTSFGPLVAFSVLTSLAGLLDMAVPGTASARTSSTSPFSAQTRGDCPFGRLAGQIMDVHGPAGQIVLSRAGRRLPAFPIRCILYGDRLSVGPDALVRVSTARGVREFGGTGEAPVWAPQGREPEGPSYVIASVESAVGTLFGHGGIRQEYAVGRDLEICRDDQYSGRSVAALSRMPPVPQAFGSDLTEMVVAWTSGGARSRISLIGDNGETVAEIQSCNATIATLALPVGRLRPGERLTLKIEDTQGGALSYPIEIVAPERLEHPAEPVDGWLLGAWRLTRHNNALRLDALSRIALGADDSYAARRILDAMAANENF